MWKVCYGVIMAINHGPISISDKTAYHKDPLKPWSCEIGGLNYRIVLKFDRHISSTTANAKVPAKF